MIIKNKKIILVYYFKNYISIKILKPVKYKFIIYLFIIININLLVIKNNF